MMEQTFESILGKSADIIECIMQSPDIPNDEDIQFKVRLCVEEVAENIVNYAYGDGDGYVIVETKMENGKLIISFCDAGIPFNPLEKEDPDITASIEDRQIGGLGIFICKQMMDNLTYSYEDGCNKLQMELNI